MLVLLALLGCSRTDTRDKTIAVSSDDAEMNAAIATARSKLPEFWKTFDKPGQGEKDFSLKVKITDDNGTEYFWVIPVEKKGGKIYGTINNDPDIVKSVKLGQRIEVREDAVADWLFMRNGKMVGNYTLRPLLKQMPTEEADKLKAMMESP